MGPKDSVAGGHPPGYGARSAAKAASWALTGSVGQELAPRGIAVAVLRVGLMDMAGRVAADLRTDPASKATQALDGLQCGLLEFVADDVSCQVEQSLATKPAAA
ncbi:NAD(P)-dependent dehydrogenase (short-subunit alcohol dehydrogenase family) [Streptomyces atratus]|uniref:hypothetical protein n=1 Tax=Streptomyces atratus TaxID=1893 RepID=UPI003393BEDA